MNKSKCVFLYRTEKWNYKMENNIIRGKMSRKANLFFSMDYFDFCMAVETKFQGELFGRYEDTVPEDEGRIEDSISSFNKNSSSKQVFSFCCGELEEDPFSQDRRYLIITTVSLNPVMLENMRQNEIYPKVKKYKQLLGKMLSEGLAKDDVFGVYQILSNEDFAVVIATNNPMAYYAQILPDIRSKKGEDNTSVIFAHTYTIQNYALQYDESRKKYVLKGKDEFTGTHILRSRVSKRFWEKYHCFPVVKNARYRVDQASNLIGKYNVLFKMSNTEFEKLTGILVEKKLGLCTDICEMNKKEISSLQDIEDFVLSESFSYVNERMLFVPAACPLAEEDMKIEGVQEKPLDRSRQPDSEVERKAEGYKEKISVLLTELRTTLVEKTESLNNIYRISKIFECCAAMGRNRQLVPTVAYILEFIYLLLLEAKENRAMVNGISEREGSFEKYLKIGTDIISTLFTVSTDKIYDNLQAPNYDVDYTYATEKVLRAYAQILYEFCVKYRTALPNGMANSSIYKPLVIPDPYHSSVYMRILFRDAAIRNNDMRIEKNRIKTAETGNKERILLINSPFDKKILEPSEYIPILFHELGHYLPPNDRTARNRFFAAYLSMIQKIEYPVLMDEILEDEYEWDLIKRCKDREFGDVYSKQVMDGLIGSLKNMYEELATDNLLDIWVDQLRNLTGLLVSKSERYHHFFWKVYEELKAILDSGSDGDCCLESEERAMKEAYAGLWQNPEDEYENLGMEKLQQALVKYLNHTAEDEKEALQCYRTAGKNLLKQLKSVVNDRLKSLIEDAKKLVPEADFSILYKKDLSKTGTKKWWKENIKEKITCEKERIIGEHIKGVLDFAEDVSNKIRQLNKMKGYIFLSPSSREITDELIYIQNRWIQILQEDIRGKMLKTKNTGPLYDRECLQRQTGLLPERCSLDTVREEDEKLFQKLMNRVFRKISEINDEVFVKARRSFRESVADFTMCLVCKYSPEEYMTQVSEYLQNAGDFNVNRIVLALYMLAIHNGILLENEDEWKKFWENALRSVEDNACKAALLGNALKVYRDYWNAADTIKWSVQTICEVSEEYSPPDIMKKDTKEKISDFYLEYYYRSRLSVIETEEETC